jgi:hypothetical protein
MCDELSNMLHNLLAASRTSVPSNWSQNLWSSSKECGISAIISNRTCLSCLTRTPNNLLPCSHLVCDCCVENLRYRQPRENQDVVVSRCPFGCRWTVNQCLIQKKPVEAGVRILSLDGYVTLHLPFSAIFLRHAHADTNLTAEGFVVLSS